MTEVPVGGLIALALIAVVLAAALSAAETAVLRLGRGALGELEASSLPSARRAVRLMADAQVAA
jgi:Mg2+/Co2+ transporter CorB